MKEYRFVCTRKLTEKETGKITIEQDAIPCTTYGYRHGGWTGTDREIAFRNLKDIIREAQEYDKSTRRSTSWPYLCDQSDIRIQSREVSPWEDE